MEEQKPRAYGREDRGIQDTLNAVENEQNRELLRRFVDEKLANGEEIKPIACKLYSYKKLANSLNKPFVEASKEDLVQLFTNQAYNKVFHKKLIRHLYRWLKKAELIEWISTKKSKREIQETRTKITITEEQAAAFLAACDNAQDRALFELLADKAPKRPKDIENLRVKDVSVNELGVSIRFSSKTEAGNRTVYLQNSRAAFMEFWKNHPFKDNHKGPVFYNLNRAFYGQPLKYGGIKERFNKALKLAKLPEDIKRNFTLYTWRRSVATWLLQDPDYTPKEVQKMGGWSSIRMLDVYGKITDEMVNLKKQVLEAKRDPELLRKLLEKSRTNKGLAKLMVKHGLIKDGEAEDILGSILCPRCKQENMFNADVCTKCWLPLNKKGYEDITKERERNTDILRLVLTLITKGKTIQEGIKNMEDPQLQEQLEKLTKEYLNP